VVGHDQETSPPNCDMCRAGQCHTEEKETGGPTGGKRRNTSSTERCTTCKEDRARDEKGKRAQGSNRSGRDTSQHGPTEGPLFTLGAGGARQKGGETKTKVQ